jgi:predicted AlkP superfamily pyrophosphatase or phosphodiesterase
MPILSALMQEGAYTLHAQTIHPSATLPAHASMLTGLCPDQHGVNWNDYIPENGYAQGTSIFTLAKQAGLYTVMIVNKEKLRQITPPESTDVFLYVNDRDVVIAEQAAPILKEGFDLALVHFATTDAMGHVHGWLSPEQLSVVRRADEAVGALLTALDQAGLRKDTLIIVTADHGGHDDLHGTWLPQDMTIPWAVIGPEVIPQTITQPVNVADTAATAAWALNLSPLPDAAGLPILEAFGQASPPRADPRCP